MITVIQRVTSAHVDVNDKTVAEIKTGILALVGIERGDEQAQSERLLNRIINYRIFPDAAGKMNLSLQDIRGGLLLVPQFTLVADTNSGTRPGFSSAAPPAEGARVFAQLCQHAAVLYAEVKAGIFGADMQVHLVNDGPVTFYLRCE